MQIIYVNDKREIVENMEDMLALVSEHMGDDAREYLEANVSELEYTASHAMEIARDECPDSDSYEADLESNARAFTDIQTEIDSLAKMERFSRKAILGAIKNIQTIINNQI